MTYKLNKLNGSVCINLTKPSKEEYPLLSRLLKDDCIHWSSEYSYDVNYKHKTIQVTFCEGQNIVKRPSKDHSKKNNRYDVYLNNRPFDEGSQGTCYLSPCNYRFDKKKMFKKKKLNYKNISLRPRLVKYTPYAITEEMVDEEEKQILTSDQLEELSEQTKLKIKKMCTKEFKLAHKVDNYNQEYGLHVKKPVDIGTGMLMSMRKIVGENLCDLLNQDIKAPCLTFKERLLLAIDIVQAFTVCTQAGVLHRDIKIDNIIADPETGRSRFCDYGLSTDLNHPDNGRAGSIPYLAPELWDDNGDKCSEATDLYSMGRVLFLLFRGSALSYYIDDDTM